MPSLGDRADEIIRRIDVGLQDSDEGAFLAVHPDRCWKCYRGEVPDGSKTGLCESCIAVLRAESDLPHAPAPPLSMADLVPVTAEQVDRLPAEARQRYLVTDRPGGGVYLNRRQFDDDLAAISGLPEGITERIVEVMVPIFAQFAAEMNAIGAQLLEAHRKRGRYTCHRHGEQPGPFCRTCVRGR